MRTYLMVAMLMALACASSRTNEDEDLLDRERFSDVLLEAQLIEARVNHELVIEQIGDIPTGRYYEELFREKGTDKLQFARTYAHYAARPEELRTIYEEIVTELARRKDITSQ